LYNLIDEVIDKFYYTIGEVSEILNTPASQLRFWSGEFDLKIRKNRKGDRLFQKEDMEMLRQIRYLLKVEGYTIEGAKKHLKLHKNVEVKVEMNATSSDLSLIKTELLALKKSLEEIRDNMHLYS
jgi:DNA-binding transcriptional MerR regulator